MRILILDISKFYGGADVRVLDLARALKGQHDYLVGVLAGSELHQRLERENLPTLPIPYRRSDPRLLPFLLAQIRQQGIQAIDAHNPQSQFWGAVAGKLAGIRIIATVHSSYRKEHQGSLKGRMYEHILRLNRAMGAQFIAVTEAVRDYLYSVPIPEKNVALIHNSLLPPSVSGTDRHHHELFQTLKIDEEAFVVISVGRLETVKGHTFLVEASAQVAADYPHFRVLIVGEGRIREALESQIATFHLQEVVHLVGFRNDIPELLARSNLFCLPSLSEGLPYALLEASALKLPFLVSAVGGMAELLTHQETAYLVPPSDPQALAAGLRWIMDHPEETEGLRRAAHEMIQAKFSPTKMINQTLAVYAP